MSQVHWNGRRWVLLLLTVGLLVVSVGLFNFYRQVEQIKRTGQAIQVQVIGKERGGGKNPNKVIALVGKQPVRISTRSKSFFRSSAVGQVVTVLKRPDSDLYVPPGEPITFSLVMMVVIWGVVIMLLYQIFTKKL
ncbi:hypothetical protein GCM10028808_16110 [Spirosoma migulaei]